jgi:ABC-type sulfate transport system substrate-binding protein
MKRLLVYVLVLVSLAACAGSASFGRHNCSKEGEVCVDLRAEEPISFGGSVTVTITVTSGKDIPVLGVSLAHDVDVVVQGPEGWEKDSRDITFSKSVASWATMVEANRSITFKRTLFLSPSLTMSH